MAEETKAPEAFTTATVPAAESEPDRSAKSEDKSGPTQPGGVSASRLGWVALLPLLALAAAAMWSVSPVLAVGVLGGVVVLACVVAVVWLLVRLLTRRRVSRSSTATAPAAQAGAAPAGGRAPRGAGGGRRSGGSRSNSGRAPARGSDDGRGGGGWWSRRGDRGNNSTSSGRGAGREARRGRQPGAEQPGKQPKSGAQPPPGWWSRWRNKSDTTGPKGAKTPAGGTKGGASTPGSPSGGSNRPRSRHPGGGPDHPGRDRSRSADRGPTKKSRWRRRNRTTDEPRDRPAEGRDKEPRRNRWWRGESREWQQWPDREKPAQPDQQKHVPTAAAGTGGKTKRSRRRRQRKAPESKPEQAVIPGDPVPAPDAELAAAEARIAANRQGRASATLRRTDPPPREAAEGLARYPARITPSSPASPGGDPQESTRKEGAPQGAPERTGMSAPTSAPLDFGGLPALDASTTPRLIATLIGRADASKLKAAEHLNKAQALRAEAGRCAADGDDYSDFLAQADVHETQAQALVARASAYEDSAAAEAVGMGSS